MQSATSPCRCFWHWCQSFTRLALFLLLFLWLGQSPLLAQEAASSPLLLGSLSGTVRDIDQNPLAGITVQLYPKSSSSVYRTTTTDQAGEYTFQELPTGLYRVGFSSDKEPYVPNYYLFGPTLDHAATVPVNANHVTGIDGELTLGGRITGTIMFAPQDELIVGSLTAYAVGSEAPTFSISLDSTHLASQPFELNGIPAERDYHLRSVIYVWENNVPFGPYVEYYDDELVEERATTLRVSAGQVISNVQIMLGQNQHYGELYGRVTNTEGEPLPNVRVSAHLSATYGWSIQRSTWSDLAGEYSFPWLMNGEYALCFEAPYDAGYASRCYPQISLSEITTPISLTAGSVITGVQVQLARAGEISGRVLLDVPWEGRGSVFGRVTLYRASEMGLIYVNDRFFSQLPTNFSFSHLAPGSYRLFAIADDGTRRYGEFYDNAFTITEATEIVLAADQVLSGIELSLGENAAYGRLQGRVTDATTGLPAADVRVIAQTVPDVSPSYSVSGLSDAAGNYEIGGLLSFEYTLCFQSDNERYQSGCYQERAPITVTVGATLTGIDMALQPASFISGTIRMTNDVLRDRAELTLWWQLFPDLPDFWFPGPSYSLYGLAGETSYPYTIFGMPAGRYRLELRLPEDNYFAPTRSFFHPATSSLNEATVIEVVDGQGITGIDIIVPDQADASIAGQVTYFGQPQSGIRVEVERSGEYDVLVYVLTNEQGEYQVNGLRPGTYYLRFVDPTGIIPPSHYADPNDYGSLPIRLADGSQATHANFDLGTKSFMRYIINQLFLPLIEQP
jgi:5-hydroxyisourate hydrolase-like protein (transthyretin family)